MKISNYKKEHRHHRSLCRQVQKALMDYLEGQLSTDEQNMVTVHLRDCRRCETERENLERTLDLLSHRELPEPDEQFWMDLKYRVRQGIREGRSISAPKPAAPARVWVPATVVASVFIFFFLWWAGHPLPPEPGRSPILSRMQLEGQQSLKTLGQLYQEDDDFLLTRSLGDSLVELLASNYHPSETLERALIGEKMEENPELWESVIEEETFSETPLEKLIEELSENQLRELSSRLRGFLG